MEALIRVIIFSLLHLLRGGLCGDIVVGYAPPPLRFGSAPELRLSETVGVLAASLGYSTISSPWKGLTATSFNYPSSVVLFGIQSGGSTVQRAGSSYAVKEDVFLNDVYESLITIVGNQAQRPIHFENTPVTDLLSDNGESLSFTFKSLNKSKIPDATFLKQMEKLPSVSVKVNTVSSQKHGGQDIIFICIASYGSVVSHYGVDSPQVKEASDILRTALSEAMQTLKMVYNNDLVFASIMIDRSKGHIRQKRSDPPPNELFGVKTMEDYNIAVEYSEDYPVIFNIVLILSIMLIVALIAISVAMATMDPGRDSIIYRMTNPRMKKEQ